MSWPLCLPDASSASCRGRYNCKEEFQIHDELLKAHYTLGRLSDATLEHYLVQVRPGLPLSPFLPPAPSSPPSPGSPPVSPPPGLSPWPPSLPHPILWDPDPTCSQSLATL